MKKLFFLGIMLIPLFLTLGLVLSFFLGIYKINHLDYNRIYEQLQEYLEQEKCSVSASIEGDTLRLDYNYYVKNGPYKPAHKEFVFDSSPGDYLIYIYGPSFLVSKPRFFKGEFPFFPKLLEEKLNKGFEKKFTVINFGMEGLDSFDLKEIVKKTLNCKAADLVIYYDLSASDFECAFFARVKNNFDLVRGFLKKLSTFFIFKKPPKAGGLNRLADWFLRASVEPNLINLAQRLSLIEIPEEPFKKYNELIFSFYKRNIYEAVKVTQSKNIPFIIVTSLSNLEAKPYGICRITDRYYALGIKEKDYFKRIEYLALAKDTEIFSGELVSKSYVYDFLRNLKEKNVYVFDLKKRLEETEFDFSYKNFYDYGHMNPCSHYLIANHLYEFLNTHEDISPAFSF